MLLYHSYAQIGSKTELDTFLVNNIRHRDDASLALIEIIPQNGPFGDYLKYREAITKMISDLCVKNAIMNSIASNYTYDLDKHIATGWEIKNNKFRILFKDLNNNKIELMLNGLKNDIKNYYKLNKFDIFIAIGLSGLFKFITPKKIEKRNGKNSHTRDEKNKDLWIKRAEYALNMSKQNEYKIIWCPKKIKDGMGNKIDNKIGNKIKKKKNKTTNSKTKNTKISTKSKRNKSRSKPPKNVKVSSKRRNKVPKVPKKK